MVQLLIGLLLLVAAAPARAQIPEALPPGPVETAAFPCRTVTQVPEEELRRLGRFAALPEHFEAWRQRNCWPWILDDERLRTASSALGAVIGVGGHDALVVSIDPDWIRRCPEQRGLRPRLTRVTGADWLAIESRIAAHPGLGALEVLEIGFARAEAGAKNLFALHLGTRDRATRVECFEDFPELLDQAARVFSGAARQE